MKKILDKDNIATWGIILVGLIAILFTFVWGFSTAANKDNERRIVALFVEDIKKQLNYNNKEDEFSYSFEKIEPDTKNGIDFSCIMDFYTWSAEGSYSKWVCIHDKRNKVVDCDMLFIRTF